MTYARPILEPVNASSASAGCCTPLFYFVIAGKVIVRGPCALGGGGGEDPSG